MGASLPREGYGAQIPNRPSAKEIKAHPRLRGLLERKGGVGCNHRAFLNPASFHLATSAQDLAHRSSSTLPVGKDWFGSSARAIPELGVKAFSVLPVVGLIPGLGKGWDSPFREGCCQVDCRSYSHDGSEDSPHSRMSPLSPELLKKMYTRGLVLEAPSLVGLKHLYGPGFSTLPPLGSGTG